MLEKIKEKLNTPFMVFVLQISVVAVVIVSVTAIKFLDGDIFNDLKKWYVLNFQDETDADEVINPQIESVPKKEDVKNESLVVNTTELPVISLNIAGESDKSGEINSLCVPLLNATISSDFGARNNPITHAYESHKGLDLVADMGSDIYAAADGVVTLAQRSSSYGNYVIIDHGNGLNTLYAHCSRLNVQQGDIVKKAETIAFVGSTGQSTRPHLHFEVILNGKNLNPNWLINW